MLNEIENENEIEVELIAVGSKNPVKVASALAGFQTMFPPRNFSAAGFGVASNVSDQPMSDEETLRGARNRAQALTERAPAAKFHVGIEGGIETIGDDLFASAWIVIVDVSTRQEAIGKSAIFALPPKVKQLIESGVELGIANDQVFAERNSKQSGGAIGSLTGGVLDRQELYEHAMVAALVPLKNRDLFPN
jgi:inosine/xanthosine triphosphatase